MLTNESEGRMQAFAITVWETEEKSVLKVPKTQLEPEKIVVRRRCGQNWSSFQQSTLASQQFIKGVRSGPAPIETVVDGSCQAVSVGTG